jgi:hypothetical protein
MNRVILCGRLGQDPEVRFTGTGKAVCTLSLATNERWTDGTGAKQQRTEWHRVQVWGKQAEACGQYLAKATGARRGSTPHAAVRARRHDELRNRDRGYACRVPRRGTARAAGAHAGP